MQIRILGGFDLRAGGQPLPALESARAESLLAYLLVHRGTRVAREHLAFVLWPDSSEPQARTNLRHVLHTLRRRLPDLEPSLEVTPRTLQWRSEAPVELDLATFEAALSRGDDEAAVEAYGGDLLTGAYDEWLLPERERLRHQYLAALDRLAARAEAAGDHGAAIAHAERLLVEDPLRESAYRHLIRAHDALGDRSRALRTYHACTTTLERTLGVAPSDETRAAYDALFGGATDVAGPDRPAFVGRAAERARLTDLWRASERGRSQLVLVTGEPGVGKTRLVEELRSWCEQRGATTAEARSYAAEDEIAYGPVAAWLRSEAHTAQRIRLDRGRRAELARVLPEISGLPPVEPLPEAERRLRLFDALAHALVAPAGPLLLVADDLHWADRESLGLIHYLLRSRPDAPLLIAATARTEDREALAELTRGLAVLERISEIELGRLSRHETRVLAEHFGSPDDPERLFAETDGNPLFVVEALRSGWTSGALSPRVQAVIEGRLARLSEPARQLAGVAAAIGREFSADVLAAASETDVIAALDELWQRRIVREQGPDGYDFAHDKIREVAYRRLGPAQRRRTHLRLARALETLQPDQPGRVADHYDRAGAPAEAVAWYERAAETALRMHASAEAIRLLERALTLAADSERELAVTTTLLPLVANAEGFACDRVQRLQRRALELAPEPSPPLLRSLALTALSRSDFEAAGRHGVALGARGERDGDGVLRVESEYVLGIAAFWQGALPAAREHFEAAIARYRPEYRTTHTLRFGVDPYIVCVSRLANTLAFLGEPDAARRARDEALAVATDAGHAPSTETVLVFASLLALDLGDDVRPYAAALARATVKPAAVTGEALAGYVQVLDGQRQAGLARARRALDGAGFDAPGHRATLARIVLAACVAAGDTDAGVAAAEDLLAAGAGAPLWAPVARAFLRNARGTAAPA